MLYDNIFGLDDEKNYAKLSIKVEKHSEKIMPE